MKKLLFLCVFSVFGLCDEIQRMYQVETQIQNDLALDVFMVIIAILGALFLFSIARVDRQEQQKKMIKEASDDGKGKIISTMVNTPAKNIDICIAFNLYFDILHKIAARKNNVVFFEIDPSVPRNVKMNYMQVCPMLFDIVEFMLDELSDSKIVISVRTSKKLYEYEYSCQFTIRANKLFSGLKNGELNEVLDGKEKLLRFKKLSKALKIANLINTKILFKNMQVHSQFDFALDIEISGKPVFSDLSEFKGKKAVILEHDKLAFFLLATKLKKLGLNVFQRYDIKHVQEHLNNSFFKPDYVFLSTKSLQKLEQNEIADIRQGKAENDYKIILVSYSEKYDIAYYDVNHDFILGLPFSADALMASTPPISKKKNEEDEKEIEK